MHILKCHVLAQACWFAGDSMVVDAPLGSTFLDAGVNSHDQLCVWSKGDPTAPEAVFRFFLSQDDCDTAVNDAWQYVGRDRKRGVLVFMDPVADV